MQPNAALKQPRIAAPRVDRLRSMLTNSAEFATFCSHADRRPDKMMNINAADASPA
jgi:hypothetical protein